MVNIKIFLIKRHDEQVFIYHYLLNKRDGKRTERKRKYDHIYLTFSENSTKNDIIYCHCSWLFPSVLYHYFLKSSVLLSKLLLTLKYMLSIFSCSQNQDWMIHSHDSSQLFFAHRAIIHSMINIKSAVVSLFWWNLFAKDFNYSLSNYFNLLFFPWIWLYWQQKQE